MGGSWNGSEVDRDTLPVSYKFFRQGGGLLYVQLFFCHRSPSSEAILAVVILDALRIGRLLAGHDVS